VDPVRFLTNRSSGRMGYAIAGAAWRRGAHVILITGPSALDAPTGPEVVLGHATLDDVERKVGDLTVISRGAPVENPTDLLGSEKMADAVEALAHGFDLVIFDTPPVLAVADVLVLAPRLDTTLL